MSYTSAERSETPHTATKEHLPPSLPTFKKERDPLTGLEWTEVFGQDEDTPLHLETMKDAPAAAVLTEMSESCRKAHAGHVIRQRLRVRRAGVVEYLYAHKGKEHTIYLNPTSRHVEDLTGPIQQEIENIDRQAEKAYSDTRLEDAYRYNLRSLCMDEASPAEKELRGRIFAALFWRYFMPGAVTAGAASFAWWRSGREVLGLSFSPLTLLWLVPLALSVLLLVRDVALSFSAPKTRTVVGMLLGASSFLTTVRLSASPSLWFEWLPFSLALLGMIVAGIWRFEEQKRRTKIEECMKQFPSTEALEKWVQAIEPNRDAERFTIAVCVATALLLLTGNLGIYAWQVVSKKTPTPDRSESPEKQAPVKESTAKETAAPRLLPLGERVQPGAHPPQPQLESIPVAQPPAEQPAAKGAVSTIETTPARPAAPGPVAGQPWVVSDAGLEMKSIKPGTFRMGKGHQRGLTGPETEVTLSEPFWLGRTEVTQGQWVKIMGVNPSYNQGDNQLPVEQVSWDDAMEFCRRLTFYGRLHHLLSDDWRYSLPTEAQWEFACRAGTTGDFAMPLPSTAWFAQGSEDRSHPVALLRANGWGLYDMHGNVREWCLDSWESSLMGAAVTDPQGANDFPNHAIRGGNAQ
jgi:formylglycine-generating enzyme required for sulfatase activity